MHYLLWAPAPLDSAMKRTLVPAFTVPLLLAAPLAAQVDLGASVSFGDSLTHNDLLYLIEGLPRDMYADDPFQAAFSRAAEPSDGLSSYAVGGSESRHLRAQIDIFDFMVLIGVEDRPSLINIEIGANDINNNRSLLASAAPGVDPEADAVIDRLMANLERDARHLARKYRSADIVLWTVPDVLLTPDHWGEYDATERANLRAHTLRVNEAIRDAALYARLAVYDFKLLMDDLVDAPPVLFDHALIPPPDYGEYDNLFADYLHPTAVQNGYHGNGILEQMMATWGGSYTLYSERDLADLAHIP